MLPCVKSLALEGAQELRPLPSSLSLGQQNHGLPNPGKLLLCLSGETKTDQREKGTCTYGDPANQPQNPTDGSENPCPPAGNKSSVNVSAEKFYISH